MRRASWLPGKSAVVIMSESESDIVLLQLFAVHKDFAALEIDIDGLTADCYDTLYYLLLKSRMSEHYTVIVENVHIGGISHNDVPSFGMTANL